MEYMFQGIKTNIGYILSRRDAIYLDCMEQKDNNVIMKGEINSSFCSGYIPQNKWYMYCIQFKDVKVYQCFEIEILYKMKLNNVYAFSEVLNSDLCELYNLNSEEYKYILIETYDYAYILLCKEFEFSIIGQR